jgi:hypothetical protein
MRTEGLGHLKITNDPTGNRTRNLPSFGAMPRPTAPEFEFYDMLKSVSSIVYSWSTLPRDRNHQSSRSIYATNNPVLTAVRTGNLTHVTSVGRQVYRESVSWEEGEMFLGNNDNRFWEYRISYDHNKNKTPNSCCVNNPKYNKSCLCPMNADEKHPQHESYSPSPPSVNIMEA